MQLTLMTMRKGMPGFYEQGALPVLRDTSDDSKAFTNSTSFDNYIYYSSSENFFLGLARHVCNRSVCVLQ